MADPRTLRVLTLNGGGMRGYMSTVFLQRFVTQWKAAGMVGSLADNFDVIAGTSIGAIQACYYGLGKDAQQASGEEFDEMLDLFQNDGKWIFTTKGITDLGCDSSVASNRAGADDYLEYVVGALGLYESFCDDSNYGSAKLYEVIESVLGDAKLSDMLTTVLIPALNASTTQPTYFSNYDGVPIFQGREELASNVACASSAAPVYFPEFEFSGQKYIDGGLFQNDPSNLAITLAKMQEPQYERVCVLNVGTGILPDRLFSEVVVGVPLEDLTGFDTLAALLTVGIGETAKTTSTDMHLRSQLTLEKLNYYSFNPIIQEASLDISTDAYLNGGGDDSSPENPILGLKQIANNWYDQETDEITNFIGHLTA